MLRGRTLLQSSAKAPLGMRVPSTPRHVCAHVLRSTACNSSAEIVPSLSASSAAMPAAHAPRVSQLSIPASASKAPSSAFVICPSGLASASRLIENPVSWKMGLVTTTPPGDQGWSPVILRAIAQIKADVSVHLQATRIERVCEEIGHTWRERVLPPAVTVHAFLLQRACHT
jgi:hypothetical protein